MKKTLILIIIIIIIAIVLIMIKFSAYQNAQNEIKKFNLTYEKYLEKSMYGSEVGSIINSAIDNNEKYNIKKDENFRFVDDDKYCVIVEINIPTLNDNGDEIEDLYRMEAIDELGVDRFVSNFSVYKFECQEKKYNSLGRISYIKIKMNV